MNTATIKATAIATLSLGLLWTADVATAAIFPDPGYPAVPCPTHQTDAPCSFTPQSGDRQLTRIGTQFVRGDDLTGAGVLAPGSVAHHPGDRGLMRIGTQFVRGDDLTGGGVLAPGWVIEAP